MSNHSNIFQRNKGLLFVISGPSASGKTTLVKRVCEDEKLWFSVSATTRIPRQGEVDGVDYFFYSTEEFKKKIANNEFFEHAQVHDNFYGTPKEAIRDKLASGTDVLLDLDVQGAEQIFSSDNEAILIYIVPPSRKILEERLLNRATDSEESIRKRLTIADTELAISHMYKYLIVNDRLDIAIEDMKAILRAERLRMPEGGIDKSWDQEKQKT